MYRHVTNHIIDCNSTSAGQRDNKYPPAVRPPYIHVYIYIYTLCLSLSLYIYIYIYIYVGSKDAQSVLFLFIVCIVVMLSSMYVCLGCTRVADVYT